MSNQNTAPRITAVDYNPDMALVTFDNGVIVTYHAPFLFSVREDDSNAVITTEADGKESSKMEFGEPLS